MRLRVLERIGKITNMVASMGQSLSFSRTDCCGFIHSSLNLFPF